MKITHLTTLKHKLQWLVLLAALLGVSQGVWATTYYMRGEFNNWGADALTLEDGWYKSPYYELNNNDTKRFKITDNNSWSGSEWYEWETSAQKGDVSCTTARIPEGDTGITIKNENGYNGTVRIWFNASTKKCAYEFPLFSIAQADSWSTTDTNYILEWDGSYFSVSLGAQSSDYVITFQVVKMGTWNDACSNISDSSPTAKNGCGSGEKVNNGMGGYNARITLTKNVSDITIKYSTSGTIYYVLTPACSALSISTDPSSTNRSYCVGATANTLSVTASGTSLSYQWQQCDTQDGTYANVTTGTGGTTASFTPSTASTGTLYYKCKVTDSCGNSVTSSASGSYTVNANPSKPTIKSYTASVCSGGAPTFTVASSTGLTYQMYTGGYTSGSSVAGEDSKDKTLTAAVITSAASYVMRATDGNDCYAESDASSVSITPDMALTSITLTPSNICVGGTSEVSLTGLNIGGAGVVTYTSGTPAVATIAAKDPATAGATATAVTAGTSEIKVTVNGGCGSKVEKTLTLTVNPNAAAGNFTLSNNSKPYNTESQSPTITAAAGMGTYTTYYTGKSGTVYAKSETAPTNAGTYDVTVHVTGSGASFCPASEFSIGDFEITKIDQPTAVTIDNETTSYCVSTLGTDIPLEASGGDGTGAYSFTITGGTVAADKRSIRGSTLTVSAAGTVIITATRVADNNYNARVSTPKEFTFTANGPKVFILTNEGASALCGKGDGSSTGTGGSLRLTGSEIGYSYQLKKDDANYGDPVAGTGSALTFPVTSSGVYTCTAYYGDPSQCPTEMNVEDGGIVLVVNITPRLLPGTPTVRQYQAVTITSTNTEIDKWVLSGEGADAYTYDSTPNSITLKANTAGSPYRLIATTSAGCTATAVITVIADTENCVAP